MAVYRSLFSLPLIWGLLPEAKSDLRRFGVGLLSAFFIVVIALCDGVGCDWGACTEHYFIIGRETFEQAIVAFDPFHVLVNRVSWSLALDLYGVDSFYAIIFTVGLFKFIDRQPIPWLALACAVPYMVSVVAMGYLRQAGALGMLMLAFLAFADHQVKKFILFVFLAAAMHKTALIFLPFSLLINGARLNVSGVGAMVLTLGLGGAALIGATENYGTNYVGAKVMQSDGGLVRSLMNGLPAVAFFALRKSYKRMYRDYDFLRYMAILALLTVPLVSVASTAVDRIVDYISCRFRSRSFLVFQTFAGIVLFACRRASQSSSHMRRSFSSGSTSHRWRSSAGCLIAASCSEIRWPRARSVIRRIGVCVKIRIHLIVCTLPALWEVDLAEDRERALSCVKSVTQGRSAQGLTKTGCSAAISLNSKVNVSLLRVGGTWRMCSQKPRFERRRSEQNHANDVRYAVREKSSHVDTTVMASVKHQQYVINHSIRFACVRRARQYGVR